MADIRCREERLGNQSTPRNTSIESFLRSNDAFLRRQVIAGLSVALIVFGLAFNCLVFVIFHVFDRKRSFITISNRFVLNLAAANGLMSSVVLPFILYSTLVEEEGVHASVEPEDSGAGPFGSALCKTSALGTMSSIAASIGAIVLIAVDRFYAVSRPLHYANHITSTKAWAMIAGSWISSVAFSALPLFGWTRVRYHSRRYLCLPYWAGQTWLDQTTAVSVVLFCFVLPLLFMIFVYISVSMAARRTAAQARRNSSTSGISDHVTADRMYPRLSDVTISASSNRNLVRRRSSAGSCTALIFHKEDWKAAKTGVIVTLAFITCWMPFFVDLLNDAVGVPRCISEDFRGYEVFFVLLAASSCIVNPLVYVFRTKAVRSLLGAMCFSRDERDPVVLLSSAAETRRLSQPGNACIAISTNIKIEVGLTESKTYQM